MVTRGTLLLGFVHVEGEGEGILTEGLGLSLELLHLTLGYAPELENHTTGGRRLTGIDVTADDDGDMFLLLFGHGIGARGNPGK